jgi:hypothetical protein
MDARYVQTPLLCLVVLCVPLLLWLPACAGDEVERTTGVISGTVEWSGSWPQTGSMLLALFGTPPWDENYIPGPPVAYRNLTSSEGQTVSFSIHRPEVPFGTYRALIIAWKDPEDTNSATNMHPTSVYGTSLEDLAGAKSITLDEQNPDALGISMPSMVLYGTSEEMRAEYPSIL